MRLEQKIHKTFITTNKTLSLAESCTGGLIGNLITNQPGASAFFHLGVIAYDNAAKTKILGVPAKLISKYGAVSKPVAISMAQGVRQLLKTDVGLSITGIAGPGGATQTKPVGLVFIALATPQKCLVQKFLFKGTRSSIKNQAAQTALKMLANAIP